jgi:hypothetical protein
MIDSACREHTAAWRETEVVESEAGGDEEDREITVDAGRRPTGECVRQTAIDRKQTAGSNATPT